MRTNHEPHIVIIGAGIVGASLAFYLSLRTAHITIFDQDEPGQAATRASFAWINARDKDPRAYHDLNRRSLDAWPRFERKLAGDIGLRWGGELRWAATQAGAGPFAARVRLLQSWGYPIRLLSRRAVEDLEPALQTGPLSVASHSEADGHVDAVAVTHLALARARENGARIRSGTRIDRLIAASRPHPQVVTAVGLPTGETIPCDLVVLAAGVGATALAGPLGLSLPQAPTPGATVLTFPRPPLFRTVCAMHTPRDHPEMLLNIRQLADGTVMVHGGTHGGSVGDRSQEDVARLLAAAAEYLPALKGARVREIRRAMRPMPADGLPILGFCTTITNLYCAVAHSGVTLAPLIGEFGAQEILDGARIDVLEPYRIERFRDGPPTDIG